MSGSASASVIERWRFLRALLLDQLDRLQDGSLTIHTAGENVSDGAAVNVRREIEAFDKLLEETISTSSVG